MIKRAQNGDDMQYEKQFVWCAKKNPAKGDVAHVFNRKVADQVIGSAFSIFSECRPAIEFKGMSMIKLDGMTKFVKCDDCERFMRGNAKYLEQRR